MQTHENPFYNQQITPDNNNPQHNQTIQPPTAPAPPPPQSNRQNRPQNQATTPNQSQNTVTIIRNLEDSKWRNRNWAIFYYITLILFVVIAIYSVASKKLKFDLFDTEKSEKGGPPKIKHSFNMGQLMGGLAISCTFSLLWLFIMTICAKNIIKIFLILGIISQFLNAIVLLLGGQIVAAVIAGIFGLFAALYAWYVWKRIPFSEACIQVAITVFKEFKATLFVNLCMVALSLVINVIDLILAVFILSLFSEKTSNEKGEIEHNVKPVAYILMVVWLFFYYWHSIVTINVSHVTNCGVMATYFYKQYKTGVTKNCFIRAITTSFGSICFGSLIEAVIQTLKTLANMLKNKGKKDENTVLMIIGCCLECILQILGDIIEYINSYAYVLVATYGYDYCHAAKEIWKLAKSKGLDALINDDLTGIPFNVGFILNLIVTLITCVLINKEAVLSTFLAVLLGLTIYWGIIFVLISYIKTLFVLWITDPDTFARNRPQAAQKLTNALQLMYPNVDFYRTNPV